MKPYTWIPVALLLGLVLGSWGPKSEIRKLRADLQSARDKPGPTGRPTRIEGVTELLGISAAAAAAAPARVSTNEAAAPQGLAEEVERPVSGEAVASTNPVATSPRQRVAGVSGDAERALPGRLEDQIARAAELWRMRSDIARAAFISDAELTSENAISFDVLMAAMNLRLADSIEKWVDGIKEGGGPGPGPEAGIRLAREVTDSLVLTYDEMDRKLPEGWRGRLEAPLNLTDFIDPAVASPLTEVEEALPHSANWEPGSAHGEESE